MNKLILLVICILLATQYVYCSGLCKQQRCGVCCARDQIPCCSGKRWDESESAATLSVADEGALLNVEPVGVHSMVSDEEGGSFDLHEDAHISQQLNLRGPSESNSNQHHISYSVEQVATLPPNFFSANLRAERFGAPICQLDCEKIYSIGDMRPVCTCQQQQRGSRTLIEYDGHMKNGKCMNLKSLRRVNVEDQYTYIAMATQSCVSRGCTCRNVVSAKEIIAAEKGAFIAKQ